MFGSQMLEVLIGLIFVYLLLSLMCTALKEVIEARLKMRAVDLEQGLRELLHDPDGQGLTKQLYEHPLIYGLFRGDYNPGLLSKGEKSQESRYPWSSNLPSYIPSKNFAVALMNIVMPAGKPSGAPGSIRDFREALEKLPNEAVRQALEAIADTAGNDVNKMREHLETWFNTAMERVTGWYKRRTQVIILCLALAVVVMSNADTIAIARSLSIDQASRQSLVTSAQQYLAKQEQSAQTNPAPPAGGGTLASSDWRREWKERSEILQGLGLPLGWTISDPRCVPEGAAWLVKIAGWLLTTMAISLGAPFWFDLLNKFMTVRSTLKPEEKRP